MAERSRDWWCSSCQFRIYGHKDRCGKCGGHRPAFTPSVGTRGDWWCPSCRFRIYASKDRCGKCGHRRPTPGVSSSMDPRSRMPPAAAASALAGPPMHRGGIASIAERIVAYDERTGRANVSTDAIGDMMRAITEDGRTIPGIMAGMMREFNDRRPPPAPAVAAASSAPDLNPANDTQGDPECVVCMDSRRALTFQPCKHIASCRACYVALPSPKSCPVCKTAIERVENVFLA